MHVSPSLGMQSVMETKEVGQVIDLTKRLGDSFDLAAKQMYTILDKVERVFRSKNIKVSVWVGVKSDDFESVGWNGVRSVFECRAVDGRSHPIRDVVPTAPWVGGMLLHNIDNLLCNALQEKEKKTKYLESSAVAGQKFIDSMVSHD